jgi:hypothetical protein
MSPRTRVELPGSYPIDDTCAGLRAEVHGPTAPWNFAFNPTWSGPPDGIKENHYAPDGKANVCQHIGAPQNGVRDLVFSFGPAFSSRSWMSLLDLGADATLADVTLPGTHDTGTWNADSNSQCQSLNFEEQLHAGMRWFDLRLVVNVDDMEIYHAGYPQNVYLSRDILPVLRRFLLENDKETVVLCVNHEFGFAGHANDTWNSRDQAAIDAAVADALRAAGLPPGAPAGVLVAIAAATAAAAALFDSCLRALLAAGVTANKLHDRAEMPKLAGLGGCVVLMRRDPGATTGIRQLDGWPPDSTKSFTSGIGDVKFSVQDAYKYDTDYLTAKWGNVKPQLEAARTRSDGDAWYLNFTSASRAPLTTPVEIAVAEPDLQGVNYQLQGYLCSQVSPTHFGTIPMDFPEKPYGLVKLLISMNKLKGV